MNFYTVDEEKDVWEVIDTYGSKYSSSNKKITVFEKCPNLLFDLQGLTGSPIFSEAFHDEYVHNYYQVQFLSRHRKNEKFKGFIGKIYKKNEECLHQKNVEEGKEKEGEGK